MIKKQIKLHKTTKLSDGDNNNPQIVFYSRLNPTFKTNIHIKKKFVFLCLGVCSVMWTFGVWCIRKTTKKHKIIIKRK